MYSKHTEVYERKIQSHEMVKSLSASAVVLYLRICLAQSPAMTETYFYIFLLFITEIM